jgi:hypothetical protein
MEKENKTGRNMRKRRSIRGRKEGKNEIAKRDTGIKEPQERNLKLKRRKGQ